MDYKVILGDIYKLPLTTKHQKGIPSEQLRYRLGIQGKESNWYKNF
jgi:hypothetical protein